MMVCEILSLLAMILSKEGDTLMSSVTTQRLAEIPLFSHMDDEERSELRSLMSERLFQAGQVIMRAGEEGSSFQIIERGEIEIWLTDTDGKQVGLAVLGSG